MATRITVTVDNITPELISAVHALARAEGDPRPEIGLTECARWVTEICAQLDTPNLIRRAAFEHSNGESEREGLMTAEVARRRLREAPVGADFERMAKFYDDEICTAATHGARNSTCTCERD